MNNVLALKRKKLLTSDLMDNKCRQLSKARHDDT